MSTNKIESYDISKQEREVIEWRNARRKVLREDYLRQVHHPIKQGLLMDHGIYRFGVMRVAVDYCTTISGRSMVIGMGGVFASIYILMKIGNQYKNREENMIRTGQIAYADREYKFNA